MPVLRYVVGSGLAIDPDPIAAQGSLQLLAPLPDDSVAVAGPGPVFTWQSHPHASLYQLEVQASDGETLLAALVQGPVSAYRAPSFLGERVTGRTARWRVTAVDAAGRELARSDWRSLGPQ